MSSRFTCPHCGEDFSGFHDEHECDELPPTADDRCPLCEEPMDSYLNHLRECSVRSD